MLISPAFAQSSETSQETPRDQTGEIDVNVSTIWERLDSWVDGAVRAIPNIVVGLIVIAASVGLAFLIQRLIRSAFARQGRDNLGRIVGKLFRLVIIIFGVFLALTIILPTLKLGDLIAGLGIGSVAIGFAFKDILQNWLAGLLLLIRQPFEIGDQIRVEGFEGTVKRIETRATIVRTYDGRRVLIPNSEVYTNAVLVSTAHDVRRSQYDIGVGYGDDVEEAMEVMRAAAAAVDGVESAPGVQVLCTGLADFSVTLRVRWWTDSSRADVMQVFSRVLIAVKNALDEAGIDMPYETQVHLMHDQTEETDGDRARQREGWPPSREEREAAAKADQTTSGQKETEQKTAASKEASGGKPDARTSKSGTPLRRPESS